MLRIIFKTMKRNIIILVLMLLSVTCFAEQKGRNRAFSVARNLETFSAIYKQLDMMYVDTLDADVTVGAGIRAMLRSLDPYTEYYAADEVQKLKQMITGKYAGIGALIKHDLRLDRVIIDEPYEGMPADVAGLKKGDIILSIDDSSMVGKPVAYVSEHLRGDPGTTFLLKVWRPSEEIGNKEELTSNKSAAKDGKAKKANGKAAAANIKSAASDEITSKKGRFLSFKITRKAIQLPCVPYYGMIGDGIGYLMLTQFTDDCARDVRRALIDMRQQGLKGLVFDLRDNGGGSLQEAIKIVNLFVPKGLTIVTTKGKLKRSNGEFRTEAEPLDSVMPMVMLVNGNTASASEITSGSLQDLDRAVVMGTRTYGKGLVQQPVDLPHNGSLKVTISKYFIPSGRCIQAINYKHTGGGYIEHIPDSLTHEFKTRGGRTVRDGGGIKPDVEVKADSLPNIVLYLNGNGVDSTEVAQYYVMDYIRKHPQIAPANDFHLTDKDFAEFKEKVLSSGFKYDRETSRQYDRLVEMAKFEGYYEDSKAEFEALKAKLQHNLGRELDNNREIICRMIENDIIRAYYYQKGGISSTLSSDTQVQAAKKLLLNEEEYRRVLQGNR